MKNKINIAELLKDCPKGMELDCTTWENVTFEEVRNNTIIIKRNNKEPYFDTKVILNQYGCCTNYSDEKCVIFPKGKTTWEGFVPPCQFKDGDIIYNQGIKATAIFYKQTNDTTISHCFLNVLKELKICHYHSKFLSDWRLATEEEKEELFNAINDNGYCWNDESKTLEKLIKPTPKPCFKSGDTIRHKKNKAIIKTIGYIDKDNYVLYNGHILFFSEQDQYELIPNKFDISKLKPFDEILVRDFDSEVWEIDFFSKLLNGKHFKCLGSSYVQCIPYKGNEHLFDTTNKCDDYFRIWES